MSNTDNFKALNNLGLTPVAEYQRLAKLREYQRRERKEALYSYHTKNIKFVKKP